MYITGGIGSTVIGEAFTADYDLPNDTMYCETCASIGLIFFANNMLKLDVDSQYADIMEKALYNTVIDGMALDGKHFFYVNPLEVVPQLSHKDPGKSHVKTVRPAWFGCAWNPLTLPYRYWKQGKEDKAMELLEDLATNILVDSTNNNDPFWQKTAADYFTGLALGLFEDAKSEDEINLNSINAMSTFGEERCGPSKYDKEYFKIKGELSSAYISAAATITAPADTKGGITSTFRQKVRIFSSRQKLAEMLSYTDFDVTRIGKEKTAVFLKIHDEKTTYHALATIFVKQVYECLIDEAQKEDNLKLKVRTNFILDEFANMPALKDVESMITASRSRNMRFNFGIQNFSQLNKVYGKDVAETIKGNCGNMFYLITTEYAALEEISKLLGDAKPKEAKEGKPTPPIRPLVTVSDLQQMKKFEMIIKRFRNMPFKTKHKASFEIFKSKKGGWGFEDSISGYPTRESKGIKTFDIKAFVDEHRTEDSSGFSPFGGGAFVPPFGLPNMNKGVNGHSKIRNKGISNIFSQMGLVEAWGSGIKRILNAAEEYGLLKPRFQEFDKRGDVRVCGIFDFRARFAF